jgi:hypothetical protein
MGEIMKEVIASRILYCQLEGKREEVVVRFGIPLQENEYSICEYEILIAGNSEAYQIIGSDSVHALQLAMFMVGSALQSIQGASNWSWNGEPHTGLPSSLDHPILGLRS